MASPYGFAKDNILRFGLHTSKIKNFDPHYAKSSEDFIFADMVFNSLVRYVPGKHPELEPDIAQKIPEFEMVDGKQVWTINLRKNIMFHGGLNTQSYELTADDVVFSFQKAADPERSAFSGEYTGVTFKKTDRYTVQIVLDNPTSPLFFCPGLQTVKVDLSSVKKSWRKTIMRVLNPIPWEPDRLSLNDILRNTNWNWRQTRLISGVHPYWKGLRSILSQTTTNAKQPIHKAG